MFQKRNTFLNSSRSTSTQTIVNDVPEQCKTEVMEKDSETDSDKESIHSNWSDLIPINVEADKSSDAIKSRHTTEKKVCEEHSLSLI